MAMNSCPHFIKAPALLQSKYQMFRVIIRILVGGGLTSLQSVHSTAQFLIVKLVKELFFVLFAAETFLDSAWLDVLTEFYFGLRYI